MVELFKRAPSQLDEPIERILLEMETYSPEDAEYQKLVEHLDRLMKLRLEESRSKVDWNTVAVIAGNLVGIWSIVLYEHTHVVTSKALTMIVKPKQP